MLPSAASLGSHITQTNADAELVNRSGKPLTVLMARGADALDEIVDERRPAADAV
jgi:hypothetical protein